MPWREKGTATGLRYRCTAFPLLLKLLHLAARRLEQQLTVGFSCAVAAAGFEPLRSMSGAGANTRDNPQRLADFDPTNCHTGGIFDDKKRLKAAAAAAQ
jgi:hypothetical protein